MYIVSDAGSNERDEEETNGRSLEELAVVTDQSSESLSSRWQGIGRAHLNYQHHSEDGYHHKTCRTNGAMASW